jgi:hypothetical protein
MLRTMCITVLAACVVACSPVRASDPVVAGNIQGVELCPQTVCGSAVFTGLFAGNVGGKFAFGVWAAGVQHGEPLPGETDPPVAITGGQWQLQVVVLQGFRLRKVALSGDLVGALAFFDTDQFAIEAVMTVLAGGTGDIQLDALLDHTVFPPGVSGTLSQ